MDVIVVIVRRAVHDNADAVTVTMIVVLVLGRQPMQAFAEKRDADESRQQKEAQKSSIL
jgi:hypothetical protein